MRGVELAIAIALAGFGVRSVVYWSRRPFGSGDARDHLLFALYVMGRAGLWFAFSGMFLLFASAATVDPVTGEQLHAPGRAFVDAVDAYRWYALVPAVLAAVQFAAGWFLGRRTERGDQRAPGSVERGHAEQERAEQEPAEPGPGRGSNAT